MSESPHMLSLFLGGGLWGGGGGGEEATLTCRPDKYVPPNKAWFFRVSFLPLLAL